MKILFITLSNIGDCILTLPVLDRICQKYPEGKITCLVPPRPAEIFQNNPALEKVIIFDKKAKLWDKIKIFISLSKEQFDLVIDLRNSFFGAFLPAKKRSSPFRFIPGKLKHSRNRHLFWAGFENIPESINQRQSLNIRPEDYKHIEDILLKHKLINRDKLIIIAPGARSQLKCWDRENFSQVAGRLISEGWDIILAGDKEDQAICAYIKGSNDSAVNFCGKTSLTQLAALLKKAKLLITNDSAVMHLASYLNVPVVSIFGPTNELKYGPWSENKLVIKKDIACRPCEKALCRQGAADCLAKIRPSDVFNQIKSFLDDSLVSNIDTKYRRILILRNDRIGDVILSTPVIKAIRHKFPQAYISMLVSPQAKDIVEGNPYLDEVIVYDKDIKHKKWLPALKFAARLKKKKFDLAVNLHPSNRTNILIFLAGITQRLGFNRKLGFLLTHRKAHTKQEGLKHEAQYSLDLVKCLGVLGNPADIFMPIKTESELYADELFKKEGITPADKLLAINPGASCPSKIWPVERFALVAEKLAAIYGFKVLILAGPKDMVLANKITLHCGVKGKVINLAGKTSLSQMASIIKRCSLFISNDSGPVHIASALGIAVISIFGRNQPGISPKRWGPLGKKDKYLHKKEAGCIKCLAHNCRKEFACLKAITVEDVVLAAQSVLS